MAQHTKIWILLQAGYQSQVVAPSKIPRKPGERDEAMRDLSRATNPNINSA
jgi:hypothetical protein